jgi:hypothetical protein
MANARTTVRLRFPPWHVYELEGGFAVEDAEGRRLGTFYGRNSVAEARAAGTLTLEEARATALDFARLVDLLNVALDGQDDGRDDGPAAGGGGPLQPAAAQRGRRGPRQGSTSASRGRGVRTRAK